MRCPICGAEFPNPTAQAGGRAQVPKGFASPAVLRKAISTRRRKARAKRSPNKEIKITIWAKARKEADEETSGTGSNAVRRYTARNRQSPPKTATEAT